MYEQDQPDFTNGLPNPVLEIDEGRAIIGMPGEWDLYNSRRAEEMLFQQLGDRRVESIVVDLTDCAYLDSSALGAFMGVVRRGAENSKPISFRIASADIQRLFEVTGLDQVFIIERVQKPQEETAEPNWHAAFALSDGPHSPSGAAALVLDNHTRIFPKTEL